MSPATKKKGRKLSKKGVIEIDLFFISRKDLPKDLQGSVPITDVKVGNPQAYVLSMIDKLSGLYFGHYLGSGKNSKSRKHVMKSVREGQKWFEERLGTPVAKQFIVRDGGTEFAPPSELRGRVQKLGPHVEGANAHVQRIAHRLWAAKRGGLASVIKQAQDIKNNTKSTISKMTPNDAAEKTGKELAPAYNKKRQSGEPDKYKKIGVGSMVRIVTKKGKQAFYKAYQKTQYSKRLYRVNRVSKSKPHTYFVGGLWKSRDQISSPLPPIDKVSEKMLEGRTQWGNKKAPEKSPAEKKKIAVDKKAAKKAEAEKWKAAPRRSDRPKEKKVVPKKVVPKKVVKNGAFDKMNKRYQIIVKWIKGEQSKTYKGANEQKLTLKYNSMIKEGQLLVKKMKTIKKRFPNMKYISEFVLS